MVSRNPWNRTGNFVDLLSLRDMSHSNRPLHCDPGKPRHTGDRSAVGQRASLALLHEDHSLIDCGLYNEGPLPATG